MYVLTVHAMPHVMCVCMWINVIWRTLLCTMSRCMTYYCVPCQGVWRILLCTTSGAWCTDMCTISRCMTYCCVPCHDILCCVPCQGTWHTVLCRHILLRTMSRCMQVMWLGELRNEWVMWRKLVYISKKEMMHRNFVYDQSTDIDRICLQRKIANRRTTWSVSFVHIFLMCIHTMSVHRDYVGAAFSKCFSRCSCLMSEL